MANWLKYVIAFASAFAVMLLVRTLVFSIHGVLGDGLAPLYKSGDRLLINRCSYGLRIEGNGLLPYSRLLRQPVKKGDIVVVGCSTSETLGNQVGSHSVPEVGKAIYEGLQSVFGAQGIYIAAQCCEHLNRAIIIEHEAVPNAEIVNVVPQPKAGGSFATACYASFKAPVALEHIKANAGIDIGGTLIGMHLREVAVPVRLKQNHIGKAMIIAARTRPKFIGGERAHYNESLKDGYPEF